MASVAVTFDVISYRSLYSSCKYHWMLQTSADVSVEMVTRSRGSSFPGLAFSISLPFLVRPRQFFILVTLSTSLSQSFTMESSETTRSLLQRPESSGIDIIDFSFGKPSSHKPSYSRNLTKQSTIPHPAVDNPQSSREHVGEGAGRNHQAPRPDTYVDDPGRYHRRTPVFIMN